MLIRLSTPTDFSFQETLAAHGWRRLLPFVWQEETQTLQRREQMPGGSVVLLNLREEKGQIVIEISGSAADTSEEELTRRVRRMLQLDISIGEFHAFCRERPEMAPVAACKKGRMLRGASLWEDTVKVIATTNTTWAQTIAMTRRLVGKFGAEGQAFPSAPDIAAVPFETFAAGARMGYRSAYVYRLGSAVACGEIDLEAWQDGTLPAPELRKRLLSLPGIGPYGAACLLLYLGRPAHVNADSWARMLLGKELGRAVTDREVHAFFEKYGPWRGLAYTFYPWRQD